MSRMEQTKEHGIILEHDTQTESYFNFCRKGKVIRGTIIIL